MKRIKEKTQQLSALASDGKKSKSFVHNATDTFHELFLIFVAVILSGGLLYSIFENQSLWKSLWWALVTAFTVGYGDVVPQTLAGRIVGVTLMTITVFAIIPLITARIASKMIVNDDAWTDIEQQEVKQGMRKVVAYIDQQNQTKTAKRTKYVQ